MYFYIIQIFDYKYKDDIILSLTSAGVMNGTYLEGENYDNMLNNNFPIFTGFFKTKESKKQISSLFFGTVEKKKVLFDVDKLLKDSGIENKNNKLYKIIVFKGENI
jgi:hypothetical protein